jgi:CBS domain-containing protein
MTDESISGDQETSTEEYEVRGDDLLSRVKELVHEGNVRRITIKNDDGKTLIEIPLTVGLVGALLLPVWAAIGAVAALVTNCSITVERES